MALDPFDIDDDNDLIEFLEIDTAFLKAIGEWPYIAEESITKEQQINIIKQCHQEFFADSSWIAYQNKCLELDELYLSNDLNTRELLYEKLSFNGQQIVDQATDWDLPITQQNNLRYSLIQKLFYKELLEVLKPWKVKPRPFLFLQQLAKLKKLKTLSISNNYLLDIEALIEVIIKELPNLEVLEIINCNLDKLPCNINQLPQLKTLNLSNNRIHEVSTIQLPNLNTLILQNNPIEDKKRSALHQTLLNCKIIFH